MATEIVELVSQHLIAGSDIFYTPDFIKLSDIDNPEELKSKLETKGYVLKKLGSTEYGLINPY